MFMKMILPRFLVNIERWKWNDEYRIFVSNTGRFKDEYKKELPIKIGSNGYCYVQTYVGLKGTHRIVMMTWRPTRNMEDLTVDHLDHNKRNNCVTNLEWVTAAENLTRAKQDYVQLDLDNNKFEKEKDSNWVLTFGEKQNNKFQTYAEAAEWVIHTHMPNTGYNKKKTIARRIQSAVVNNKKYCNYEWKWVKVNE